MEILPATAEEVAMFKQAVAQRYKERGVDPKKADAIFNTYMAKVAEDLGMQKSAKVNKVASIIAAKLGRERKVAKA